MTSRDLPDVLVGHTGFVGGNLRTQRLFDREINSSNSSELRGGRFGDVVFSAARAEKWRANADPAADDAHVGELEDLLTSFECSTLTLISTVDVFRDPIGVDESDAPSTEELQAYGRHRLRLERTASKAHENVLIARLPGLFGPGLKKNVVFDLMHGNRLEQIQPASRFQYYDLGRLAADLARARRAGLALVHLVTHPVSTQEVLAAVFPLLELPQGQPPAAVAYDVQTMHAEPLGGRGRYLEDRVEVFEGLRSFVHQQAVSDRR